MGCPYFREIVMVYCEATSVKKAVPSKCVAAIGPCAGGDFANCALFREAAERLRRAAEEGSDKEGEEASNHAH